MGQRRVGREPAPKVVAGNWKMHHGPRSAAAYLRDFAPRVEPGSVRIALFPPDLSLRAAMDAAARTGRRGPGVEFGVQNVHWERSGALTGESAAEMAAEAGAALALIGHSERRIVFGETDDEVALKVRAAARAGLLPVVCVGESIEERRAGRLEAVLRRQVAAFADALTECDGHMVAYEPVWAIGTGETATPADASEAHGIVRAALGARGGCPLLYGGSVKPSNAAELMRAPDVDGVLVGGASLDPDVFARIAEAAPTEGSPTA